ncbi:MAG TPA: hypothetical protein VJ827_03510, partial [Rubrobacter sp.]|nr:hypothetical protein [Rubrobacter sp.]
GGNAVIGKALESLLRSVDYVARFFSEYPEEDVEPLGGAKVALILPALSSRHQESLMALIRDTPSTADLPVIELVTTPNENGNDQITRVLWPCSMEDLRRSIDEKLIEDPPDVPESRGPDNPRSHDDIARQYT